MSQSKHTPAPWIVKDKSTVYGNYNGKPYLSEIADCKGYQIEREANANLISAAPDLLSNLEQCLVCLQVIDPNNPAIEMAEAAIAKAKGNQDHAKS